jgi:hypothetical protein
VRLFLLLALRWYHRVLLLVILVSVSVGFVYWAFHYLRGRRSHERGIRCIQCARTAFPIEGIIKRYRCGICHLRFDGPEHW